MTPRVRRRYGGALATGAKLLLDPVELIVAERFFGGGEQLLKRFVELEVSIEGRDGPNLFRRMEVRDDRPELVAMGWWSRPGQREIRQKDLRDLPVSSFLDEVYPTFVSHVDRDNKQVVLATGDSPGFYAARKFVERTRAGHRAITPELLKSVADVYRRNIDHAPTQAVAKAFGVKMRMASTYVDRARKEKYLPPTKLGKKQA